MDLRSLKNKLELFAKSLKKNDKQLLETRIAGLSSVFPFNEYEFSLIFLLDKKVINFRDYENLRSSYISSNKYLNFYGLAPRIFGEIWAQDHIKDLDHRFEKPSKILDKNYLGEYDMWLEGAKIEIKAARAINTKLRGDLVSKSVKYGSNEPFWMNFQQLKPKSCDVFIFLGVWPNRILYWVLSSKQVKSSKYFSHQHRGGIEYQIGVTEKNIKFFKKFLIEPSMIYKSVISKIKPSKNL